METNVIYNEECIKGMDKLPDHSIDMILCDLPYGTTGNKWDTVIPFEELWNQYKRLIKERGSIVLTSSQPFTTNLIHSNIDNFKYCWVWDKKTFANQLNAKVQPLKIHEDICVFSYGKAIYNPQGLIKYNKMTKQGKENSTNYKGGIRPGTYFQEYTNYPKSILKFEKDSNNIHPTQKPIALFEYLIRTYTLKGGVVLDNCMGSGTTAIACINTERDYIGFELNKEYYDKSIERIKKHDHTQLDLLDYLG